MESLTRLRVPVSNGTFTVTLDYGPVPFDGMDLVIAIQVRTNYAPEMVPNPPPGRDCS